MTTKDEIEAIYNEMDTLTVGLTMAPELGPDYLKEKLAECRQKQNRAVQMFLQLSRATSTARMRLRAAQQAVRIAGASPQAEEFRRQIPDLTDEYESSRYALEALRIVRGNLKNVQTEIRTLADIITGRTGERSGMSQHIPDLPPRDTGSSPVSPEEGIRDALTTEPEEDDLDESAGVDEPVQQPEPPRTDVVEPDELRAFYGTPTTTPPPAVAAGGEDVLDIDALLEK